MKGDRVVVGTGYFWKETDKERVMAYMPRLDENQQWIVTADRTVLVESVGGVLAGSVGVVDGPVIRVSRSNIKGLQRTAGMGNDFIELVPVNLEKYQRVGYFPVDNVRILTT